MVNESEIERIERLRQDNERLNKHYRNVCELKRLRQDNFRLELECKEEDDSGIIAGALLFLAFLMGGPALIVWAIMRG